MRKPQRILPLPGGDLPRPESCLEGFGKRLLRGRRAVIVALILLGRFLEARAKGGLPKRLNVWWLQARVAHVTRGPHRGYPCRRGCADSPV
ncbi:hypothetical protein KCP76_15450 [Salmonella enterica subsp. enterica serovar Weltevreden]|nr:hypothetical protein KCP76_15450 [Salmonella enterica subsp. enterica serovar Weltevreden]